MSSQEQEQPQDPSAAGLGDVDGAGHGPPRRLRTLLHVVLMLVLFAGVVAAVDLLVPGASDHLSDADPAWLVAALAFELGGCAAYALLFHAVFARDPYPSTARRSAQIGIGELGAFAIVPTGIGGPLLRLWALRAGGMPLRTVIVRSVSHGGLLNAPYVLAAVVLGGGAALHLLPGHVETLTALAPVGLVLLVGLAVLAAVALGRAGFLRRREWVWLAQARSALAVLPDGLRDLGPSARRRWAVPGAIGWWVGDCGALWAAFQALGSPPALSVLVLAYMLGQLGSALPLPGGIGGVEPLMLGILVASGVDSGLAAAAIVCYRAVALGVQGATGALAFATLAPELRGPRRDAGVEAPS